MTLKTYPEYKDSGVEWLGDIPKHWRINRLGRFFSENKVKNRGLKENKVLSLSYGNIIERLIDDNKGLLPASFETYQVIQPDYIIFRFTDLQNDKRSLRSAISKHSGIITSAYIAVQTNENADFYNYLFRAYDLQKVFYSMGSGMRQSLRFEELANLPIVVLDKDEQQEIVSFLNSETARVDTLISKQLQLIDSLKEYIISIAMLEQLHGKGEMVRIGTIADEIHRPVLINKNKSYVTLGLYNRGRGLFHKPPTIGKDLGDSDFFYIKPDDLVLSGQFSWEGAVAMASSNETGCIASHRFPILRGKGVHTEYLLALLMTNYGDYLLNDCSRGSAGRNRPLNIRLLLKSKIRMPSLESQEKIKALLKQKSELKSAIKKNIEKLTEYRASVISHAVTGKIDVRDYEFKGLEA